MQRRFALIKHEHALADLTDFSVSGPADGQVLVYDLSTGKWINGDVAASPQSAVIDIFDDMVDGVSARSPWNTINTSTSTVDYNLSTYQDAGRPGIFTAQTQAATAASAGFIFGGATGAGAGGWLVLGGGAIILEMDINISATWTGAQTGQYRIGLMDEISGAPGAGVHAQHDGTSANWILYGRDSGGSSNDASGAVAVTTGWHNFRIEINAAATSASLYVDDVLAGTVTGNIPVGGTAALIRPGFQVQKTAGTTNYRILGDWFRYRQTLTTPRG